MSSAQTMKIYSIISRIEQVLNDSPKYKLSGGNRKIVEVGELFDLLGDLKVTIPEDIRRASGIIAEESNILGDANEQADEIVNKAKADAEDLMQQAQEAAEKVYNQSVQEYEALVSEESVYREAAERAKQIQQEAIDNANAITNGSRQYADDMLADVQRYLNDYIKMLNANREELNGQAAPEYEEKDVEKSVSEQRAMEEQKLVYLVNAEKNVPAVAMKQALLEVNRMGKLARGNLADALDFFFDPTNAELHQKIVETEETIDFLNHAIEDKLVDLRALALPDRDVFRLSRMVLVVSNFERIGDHAENIMEFGDRMTKEKAVISEIAMQELRTMGDAVLETIDVSMVVFEEERFDLLPKAEELEQRVDDMQTEYIQNHVDRLMHDSCDPLGGVIFTDMCTDLERCSDQGINIATALLPPRG